MPFEPPAEMPPAPGGDAIARMCADPVLAIEVTEEALLHMRNGDIFIALKLLKDVVAALEIGHE